MSGQITQVRAAGSRVYLRAEWPGVVTTKFRDRMIDMNELIQSQDPATYLVCELEMAMLDEREEQDVD